ncbi:MAG: hypothetical protein WCZ23_07315 [Rhodospirillaceae bacterium]
MRRISARAIVKDTMRSMRDNKRLMAFLAAPFTVIAVLVGLITQLPHPAAPLVVLPSLPLIMWFVLPLAVNIYRALLEGRERETFGIGSLFRIGRCELMILVVTLMTGAVSVGGAILAGAAGAIVTGNTGASWSWALLAVAAPLLIGGVFVSLRMQPSFVAAGLGRPAPWAVGWRMSRGNVWGIIKTALLGSGLMLALTLPFTLIYAAALIGMAALELELAIVPLMILGGIVQGLLNALATAFYITLSAMMYRHLSAGAEPVVDTPMPDLSPAPVAS